MSVQEAIQRIDNKLDHEIEMIQIASLNDIQRRSRKILHEIEANTVTAKKDVHLFIAELVKHQSQRLKTFH